MGGEDIKKRREKFNVAEEPEDLAVIRKDVTTFDKKRYNPGIMINTRLFKAPEKLLDAITESEK